MRTHQKQQMQCFPTRTVGASYLAPTCIDPCTCTGTGKAASGNAFDVPLSPGRAKRLYPYPSSNRRHRRR